MKISSLRQICLYFTVGGGSAGGVLSDRLTENGQNTVLLLEAGGDDQSPIGDKAHIPINCVLGMKTEVDWKYYTEPQKNACFAMKDKVGGISYRKISKIWRVWSLPKILTFSLLYGSMEIWVFMWFFKSLHLDHLITYSVNIVNKFTEYIQHQVKNIWPLSYCHKFVVYL